jgi:hypothetical protein
VARVEVTELGAGLVVTALGDGAGMEVMGLGNGTGVAARVVGAAVAEAVAVRESGPEGAMREFAEEAGTAGSSMVCGFM